MEALRFGMSSCGMQELTEMDFCNMKNAGVKELEISLEPENYKNLVVRVSGFSAIYVNLSKEVQKDILNRTQHE